MPKADNLFWHQHKGENQGYSLARCGFTIDIAKEQLFKDIIIVKNTADNVPVPGLLKDEKAIAFIFEDAAGTEKTTYLPVKDLIKMFEGEKAIEIDDSTDPEKTIVKLNIYDPTGDAALVQTDDGLRIMDATTDQVGVAQFAPEAEVLAATVADRMVSPYDVYNFVNNSTSVKDDLQGLYTDDDGKIVNNTIIKAINELATTTVEEFNQTTAVKADAADINTYKVKTIPEAGVVEQLGSKIHVPKTIFNVSSLLGVTGQKEYQLYYLNTKEGANFPGLYQYNETTAEWVNVGGSDALIEVEQLPEDNINPRCLYKLLDKRTVTGRFSLSTSALVAGYTINRSGIHLNTPPQDWTWAAIKTDWANWYNDEIIDDTNGRIFGLSDGTLVCDYIHVPASIYYYHENKWYLASDGQEKVNLNFGAQNANKHLIVLADGTVGLEDVITPPTVALTADQTQITYGVSTNVTLTIGVTIGTGRINHMYIYRNNVMIHDDDTTHDASYTTTYVDTVDDAADYKVVITTIDNAKGEASMYIPAIMPTYVGYFGDIASGVSSINIQTRHYATSVTMNYSSIIYKYPKMLGELEDIVVDNARGYLATFTKTEETIGSKVYYVYTQNTTVALTNCPVEFI